MERMEIVILFSKYLDIERAESGTQNSEHGVSRTGLF